MTETATGTLRRGSAVKTISHLRLLAIMSALLPMIAGCSTMAQDVHLDGTVWQPA
jgi:hypothetical protein